MILLGISIFLSILGWIYFRFYLRQRLNAKQQRVAIHTIILSALFMPVLISWAISPPHPGQVGYSVNTNLVGHECSDDDVAMCKLKYADGGFCNCDQIDKYRIVAYEENMAYNALIFLRRPAARLLQIAGIAVAVLFVLRISYLLFLVYSSRRVRSEVGGKTVFLLYHNRYKQIASFRLIRRYIIWNEDLESLNKTEQEAIMAHEWSHIEQGNTFEEIFFSLLQIFWFVNPAFYWFKKELSKISEFMADEKALEHIDQVSYAKLLLNMGQRSGIAMVQAFAQSSLAIRIKRVLENKSDRPVRSFNFAFGIMFVFLTISFTGVCAFHHHNGNIQAYETLQKKHKSTGQDYFCRHCVLGEDV